MHDSSNKSQPAGYQLTQPQRLWILGINITVAWVVFWAASGSVLPSGSGQSVWFLAIVAYWLTAMLDTPFFAPPKDTFASAVSVLLLLAPMEIPTGQSALQLAVNAVLVYSLAVAVLALYVMLSNSADAEPLRRRLSFRLLATVGKAEALLSGPLVLSAIAFYSDNTAWMVSILALWPVSVVVRPAEVAVRLFLLLRREKGQQRPKRVGMVVRIDDPGIVRVDLNGLTKTWRQDVVHAVLLPGGQRTFVLPLFIQTQDGNQVGTGLCCEGVDDSIQLGEPGEIFALDHQVIAATLIESMCGGKHSELAGIVVEGSTIGSIVFQAVPNASLTEGTVVFVRCGGQSIFYQIINASTHEENFNQNPHGAHRVVAAQLGTIVPATGFMKYPWLPAMNQPVFILTPTKDIRIDSGAVDIEVGHVPHTAISVPVELKTLVEYHAAILGVTGTGKTELVLDIIQSALGHGTKAFCVDFTGEYVKRLAHLNPKIMGLTAQEIGQLEELMVVISAEGFNAREERKKLKVLMDAMKPRIEAEVKAFVESPTDMCAVFELPGITNTRATLRATELYLSAIMAWAREHRKLKQILICLEEAHTIIPETYRAGYDTEQQWVVNQIGQIALQGRKYGVGLLVVSQRTALVSKTVLSQCNTFFVFGLVDQTSLEFLGNVLSAEHVKAIPNLRHLEFMAQGKAIRSERPIILVRPFDATKAAASAALDHVAKS